MQEEDRKTFGLKDAAEYIGVSPVTLRRWVWNKKAPKWLKISGTYIFRKEEIDAWIKKNEK